MDLESRSNIADIAVRLGIDGLIISNTTVTRPSSLKSDKSLTQEVGGLSGKPLKEISTSLIAEVALALINDLQFFFFVTHGYIYIYIYIFIDVLIYI